MGSLLATVLVAILLVYFFRRPKLELHFDYIKRTENRFPGLDLFVFNKKWYVGFGAFDVAFNLYLPGEFRNVYFGLITNEGEQDWNHDSRDMRVFKIDNQNYNQYRGTIHLPVHPISQTHFLRLKGDFPRNKKIRIYYCFKTPYGNMPSFLKFGELVKNLENENLPFIEFQTD